MFAHTELVKVANSALSLIVSEGIFALGGQLAVVVNGDVATDIAAGQAGGGIDLAPDDLHNVYCLFKPMVYLLLGHALEASGFGPDEPLDETTTLPSWAPEGLTYRQLAAHNAALAEPSAAAWKMTTSPSVQQDLLDQANKALGPAYSEISGGFIAEYVIERLSGRPPSRYCFVELLEPLGLADQVIIDAEQAMAMRERIRAPVIGLPVEPLPMLSELLPSYIRETRLAFGAFATMCGIAHLYAAVGQVLEGTPKPGLPSPALLSDLMDDDRPFRDDPILQRPAKWAAGMMTDVGKQDVSQAAGPGSFGHTGGLANGVAFYDPSRKAAVALLLNGVGAERDDFVLPRQQLADTVISAIPSC